MGVGSKEIQLSGFVKKKGLMAHMFFSENEEEVCARVGGGGWWWSCYIQASPVVGAASIKKTDMKSLERRHGKTWLPGSERARVAPTSLSEEEGSFLFLSLSVCVSLSLFLSH